MTMNDDKNIYYGIIRAMTRSTEIPGVTSANPVRMRSEGGGNLLRYVENELIRKEEGLTIEGSNVATKISQKRLTLCDSAKLPEGTECSSRVEKKGIFFCSGKDANCPFSKERA